MSSWLSKGVSRKRIRTGFYQESPAGTFVEKSKPATVVSAYYEMSSKYKSSEYRQWIRNFLENCECYLVFFCEESVAPFIHECRKEYADKTDVVVLPREEWVSNKEFTERFWKDQQLNDSESGIHSTDLYKVWFEKKEFVTRAIQKNPFKHTDFVWCDAGFCRTEGMKNLIREFPNANRIPTDKILFHNIGQFTERDSAVKNINGVLIKETSGKMRIDGSCIAASNNMWLLYSKLYDGVMEKFFKAGLFLGKDQDIMGTLVLENPGLVSLVEPAPSVPSQWFYLQLLLGAPKPLFDLLMNDTLTSRKRTYEELYDAAYPGYQPMPTLTQTESLKPLTQAPKQPILPRFSNMTLVPPSLPPPSLLPPSLPPPSQLMPPTRFATSSIAAAAASAAIEPALVATPEVAVVKSAPTIKSEEYWVQ